MEENYAPTGGDAVSGAIKPLHEDDPLTQMDLLVADRGPANPLRFSFDHDGQSFGAVVACEPERSQIVLSARLGLLPYTAEARERRLSLLQAVRGIASSSHSRLRLAPNQDIFLDVESTVSARPTMASIVAGVVQGVLTCGPLMRRLTPLFTAESGAQPG